MKRVLSIVISLTLVVGMLVGVNVFSAKADSTITNCSPTNGASVDMLSDYVYQFCSNYQKGIVNSLYKKNSNRYYPTPVTFAWDAVSGASQYTLELSTNKTLANAKTYSTNQNTIDVEDMFAGYDYYYRVSTTVGGTSYSSGIIGFKTTNLPRTLSVDKVYNTRDIGGCYVNGGKQRVLQGKVIRGARLDGVADAGTAKMLNVHGIKTELELREKSKAPTSSPLGDSVKFINISSPQYLGSPSSSNEVGGIDYPDAWPVIKQELEVFADSSNYPIYVHCNIGRDRTGTICFLIESLLGMSELDMYRDYELSYFAQISNSDVADPTAANKKTIDALIDYIKNYSTGTMQENTEKYMKECVGMTDNQIKQIKDNLLTPLEEPTTQAPTKVVPTTIKPTCVNFVQPAKVKIKSAKNSKKKSIVVKFKKAKDAKKYQIWYDKSKKFKKAKIKTTTKLSYTIKKLKKKKTYYVKVRGVNVCGTTEVYGAFSKVKKVKIRK